MIYKIDLKLTKKEGDIFLDNLTKDEIINLESYDLKAYDEIINGYMTSYLIIDRSIMSKIVLLLRKKNVSFNYKDITNDILSGTISFKGTPFENEVESFIMQEMNIDDILDKISKRGIKSLTALELKCLEKGY